MKKYIALWGIILSSLFAACGGKETSEMGETSEMDVFSAIWDFAGNVAAEQRLDFIEPGEPASEESESFYEEERNEVVTVSIDGRLREDMPEFTFELTAYYDLQTGYYQVQTIVVYNGDTVLQTISIPELTLFGQTDSREADTFGFTLEDVNFDGYQDIRLYDTLNGNYRVEWIYLVWNPGTDCFEQDKRLNDISLAQFDQEEQLIYGMERGGAAYHYYSTYQYIDGEIVRICYVEELGLSRSDEQIRQYYDMAGMETTSEAFEGYYYHVMERNETTGELETTIEEYIFYPTDIYEDGSDAEEAQRIMNEQKLYVEVSSELGAFIKEEGQG